MYFFPKKIFNLQHVFNRLAFPLLPAHHVTCRVVFRCTHPSDAREIWNGACAPVLAPITKILQNGVRHYHRAFLDTDPHGVHQLAWRQLLIYSAASRGFLEGVSLQNTYAKGELRAPVSLGRVRGLRNVCVSYRCRFEDCARVIIGFAPSEQKYPRMWVSHWRRDGAGGSARDHLADGTTNENAELF